MAAFKTLKELIRGLQTGDKLLVDMFNKRKTLAIRYDDAVDTLDGDENKLRFLISHGVILQTGNTLELDDSSILLANLFSLFLRHGCWQMPTNLLANADQLADKCRQLWWQMSATAMSGYNNLNTLIMNHELRLPPDRKSSPKGRAAKLGRVATLFNSAKCPHLCSFWYICTAKHGSQAHGGM